MNELEAKYGDRVAFSRVDARSDLGEAAYTYYGLRGHPIVALFDPDGRLLAQIWGERPIDEVEKPLQGALQGGLEGVALTPSPSPNGRGESR